MIDQWKRKSLAEAKRVTGAVVLVFAACLISQEAAVGAPSVLFASNLGGSQWDTIRAIATDASQNIYVVGETYSPDFPGAAWSSSRQTGDAFVVKLSPTGTRIYTVVLGGSGYDSARGVAADSAGNVYVTGLTSSPDFPTTNGAFQRNSGSPGQYDAFVAKVSPAGSVLYASYLGGSGTDAGYGITVDPVGAVYVAGSTNSMNFPVASNAPQSRFGGSTDCFVAKLDPTGATLTYATYLGGENMDSCTSIAVDGAGAAFVTGTTSSTAFPRVAAIDGVLAGPSDAFVTKVSPAGDRFLFSTYLGGEGADNGNVVRVDSAGNAYVAGETMSAGFPVTSGALQSQLKGGYDGFLCSIASDGSAIRFATYLGGTGADSIRDLSLATDGGILVTGYTASMDLPLMNPVQSSYGGGTFDAFVSALSPTGSSLLFSTYLGGGGDDRAFGVAPLGAGQLVFAGQLMSGTVPYVQQLYGSSPAGQYDGFLAAISYGQLPSTPPTVVIDTPAPASAVSGTVTISGWAIDNSGAIGTAISGVQLNVDGTVVGNATYGIPRPDVCAVYPGRPGCPNVGYTYQLNTLLLRPGPHVITVSASDSDSPAEVTSTSVTVTVASPPPMVFIDAPAQGSSISGVATVSGWAIGSASVLISSVQVKVDGGVVGNAVYGVSRPDVCNVYPGRLGCPNVGYTYSLNATALAPGSHTITVSATDSAGKVSSSSVKVNVPAAGVPPTVYIESPVPGAVLAGTVPVTGWAIDNSSMIGTAISKVQVTLDGVVAGTATYGIARPDVCNAFPGRPGCPNVGYTYSLNVSSVSAGSHRLCAIATDTDATADAGSSCITVQVAVQVVPPSVFIDTPQNGATVSGVVTVSGWAIDSASGPGTAISSVQVKVDSTVVGTATYGIARGDVCSVFPGRPGCPNVGYTFQWNTALLSPGSHTLTVSATDSDEIPDAGTASVTVTK